MSDLTPEGMRAPLAMPPGIDRSLDSDGPGTRAAAKRIDDFGGGARENKKKVK